MIMRNYEVRVLNLTTNQRVVKHFKTYDEMNEFILDQKEKHPIHEIGHGGPFRDPNLYYIFIKDELEVSKKD